MVTLSRTLDSNTAGSCGRSSDTAPRCVRSGRGVPSTAMARRSASTSPARTRKSELFPAPLSPIRAIRSPRRSASETPSSAGRPGTAAGCTKRTPSTRISRHPSGTVAESGARAGVLKMGSTSATSVFCRTRSFQCMAMAATTVPTCWEYWCTTTAVPTLIVPRSRYSSQA